MQPKRRTKQASELPQKQANEIPPLLLRVEGDRQDADTARETEQVAVVTATDADTLANDPEIWVMDSEELVTAHAS